jgi:hypothetical protein
MLSNQKEFREYGDYAKEKRGRFISTRLSPPEYAEIERAVTASGMAKTEWVRTKLIAAARRA